MLCIRTMLFHFVFVCSIGLAFSAPQDVPVEKSSKPSETIPILEQSQEIDKDGSYKFSFKTGDGIEREELGYENSAAESRSEDSTDESFHVQKGSYSYTAPNGEIIKVSYIADENGFQPVGDHIPQFASQAEGEPRAPKSSPIALKSSPADIPSPSTEPSSAPQEAVPSTTAVVEPEVTQGSTTAGVTPEVLPDEPSEAPSSSTPEEALSSTTPSS